MFFEDALVASKLLDITLTSRNKNDPDPIPLCGVPYHSVEPYIAKLLSFGKKVAICDQVEDPKSAKGVVKREVTRVITPGVVLDGDSIKANSYNFIAAIYLPPPAPPLRHSSAQAYKGGENINGPYGFALADVSTGYFSAAQFETLDALIQEITRLEPREILIPPTLKNQNLKFATLYTTLNEEHFNSHSIGGLDGAKALTKSHPLAAQAAAAILNYISSTQKEEAKHIRRIETSLQIPTMRIDEATKRNLELFRTMMDGGMHGTLISILDKTSTAMGARKLKNWMLYPLMDLKEIKGRLEATEHILNTNLISDLPSTLSLVYDLERIAARVAMGTASARDIVALKNSLEQVPAVLKALQEHRRAVRAEPVEARTVHPSTSLSRASVRHPSTLLRTSGQESRGSGRTVSNLIYDLIPSLDPLTDITDEIGATIIDEPPLSMRDGGLIKEGVDKELDELRSIAGGGKDSIARIEAHERARTKIPSLKVKYNKVFGYYLEVTNTHKDKVPSDYIRKQTLVNAERYITPELKEYEEKVLSAEDKIRSLEYDILCRLREKVASQIERITKTAGALATLDVLTSFALSASQYRYIKPEVNDSHEIKIIEGRHPIIERLNPTERFVPNDIYINGEDHRLLIITGPNMAGKSTVMRQTALIALLAQMGSFVPAKEATIGVVDRIFTRIGASDALALGQSTFMVEMSEATAILNQATPKSLIIIDEIGRGTSTFDGLSLAWAIAEDIHDRVKARTLFATHYHELTDLAATKDGIKNFNIAVKEWSGKVIFLRKLVPGGTSRSYGIQVAKLAGLPHSVIERSQEVLQNLEAGEFDEIGKPRIASHGDAKSTGQLHLFTKPLNSEVAEKLENVDTSTLTPIEALNILHEIKQKL